MKHFKLLMALVAIIFASSASARTDITSQYLNNADLATVNGSWTCAKYTDWQVATNETHVNVVEFWAGSGYTDNKFKISQTITLPAGYYRLAVNAFYREGWGGDGSNNNRAWIFAGEKTQNVIGLQSGALNNFATGGIGGSGDLQKASNAFYLGNFSNEFDFNLTESTTIEIGFEGQEFTGGSWCIFGPVKLYEYTASDYMADYTAKKAAAQEFLDSPMNGDTKQALIAAMVDESTLVTVDDVLNAVQALNAAMNAANTSIANYQEAKTILDAANNYDAAGQASYANNETIAAIQNSYDNRTLIALTADQKTAASAALATACKAQTQPTNGCDMTAYIENWDFLNCAKDNFPSWTIEKSTGNAQAFGTTAAEYWNGTAANGGFDFYQVVSDLPTGVYTVQALMWNSTDNESGAAGVNGECGVYGKSGSADEFAGVTADTRDEGKNIYTTVGIQVINGELRLGVKNNATMGGRWFGVDWVKLTYVRQLTAEEEEVIEKANAVEAYNEALAAAQAIADGSVPAPVYTNLQTTITNNTLSDGTSTDYNNAADALNAAATAAQPLVLPYAAWKELKAYADALVAVANDNSTANSTLSTAISDQNTEVEAATTASAIVTATSTLKEAMITYAGEANPVGDNAQFDLTFMLTNPNLEGLPTWNPADGWHTDQTDGNSQVMTNPNATSEDGTKTAFYEYWSYTAKNNGEFTLYQEVTLPEGTFKMTCYAFAKQQDDPANTGDVVGIFFYANDTQGSSVSTDRLSYKEVEFVNTTEQNVKVGLKAINPNSYNWMGIGYVQLFKVPAKEFEIDEAVAYDNTQEGAGDVTLKRTIKEGWNTVVLPFQMTAADIEILGGEGAKAYTVSAYNAATDNLTFAEAETVAPNIPFFLNATEATTGAGEFTFEGKTLVAGEPIAEVGEDCSLVGTYKKIGVPESNDNGSYYILSSGEFRKVVGDKVTIKNTRFYVATSAPAGANTLGFTFDDGEANAINGIVDETAAPEGIYNLQGQKVEKATKGIYIINGKKVLVK